MPTRPSGRMRNGGCVHYATHVCDLKNAHPVGCAALDSPAYFWSTFTRRLDADRGMQALCDTCV